MRREVRVTSKLSAALYGRDGQPCSWWWGADLAALRRFLDEDEESRFVQVHVRGPKGELVLVRPWIGAPWQSA